MRAYFVWSVVGQFQHVCVCAAGRTCNAGTCHFARSFIASTTYACHDVDCTSKADTLVCLFDRNVTKILGPATTNRKRSCEEKRIRKWIELDRRRSINSWNACTDCRLVRMGRQFSSLSFFCSAIRLITPDWLPDEFFDVGVRVSKTLGLRCSFCSLFQSSIYWF